MGTFAYLIMVNANENNNKYYQMQDNKDGTFTASYGRVGANPMKKTYRQDKWDAIYRQKLAKGYTDQTHLHAQVTETASQYETITDDKVRELIDTLISYAKKHVEREYTVSPHQVSDEMIKEAHRIIDELIDYINGKPYVYGVNERLKKLFITIPRKMSDVNAYLATSLDEDELDELIKREQTTLSIMESMKDMSTDRQDSEKKHKGTILDAVGLKIRPCTDEEISNIKRFLTAESAPRFDGAFRIELDKVESRFRTYCKDNQIGKHDIHFYYHGTGNENVWSILKTSLVLNPKAVICAKMFGYGIYFAPRAWKSINYTSLRDIPRAWRASSNDKRGYLLVFKVAYKKPYDVYTWETRYSNFHERDIKALGCDALFAHKGSMLRNDEVIVYNEAQICPRYLVQLKTLS